MNEIRKDYLLDRYVIVAENRGKRPYDYVQKAPPLKGKEGVCVFCPGNEHLTPPETGRIGGKGSKWLARSFYNKFPAVSPEFPKALGRHEVLVETPKHVAKMAELPEEQMAIGLELYSKRVHELYSSKGIGCVLIFKNEGAAAGISLTHTHSQLIALASAPCLLEEELGKYAEYRRKEKACPFCEIAESEIKSPRKAFENEEFLAIAPYASRTPFELLILPKNHISNITELGEEERLLLARILKKSLARLDKMLNGPAFNYYLHIAPRGKDFHFHIELLPRLAIWAGFELGSGMYINPMPPEKAAQSYREG